jgi:hypothetical protein
LSQIIFENIQIIFENIQIIFTALCKYVGSIMSVGKKRKLRT